MTPEATELCASIEHAFGALQYPGDDNIVYDNSGYHLECAAIKKALKARHWRDISFDTLDDMREALCFLSPGGFRFYLPAFMRIAVTDYDRADIIPGIIIRSLTPPTLSDVEERAAFLENFSKQDKGYVKISPEEVRELNAQMLGSFHSGEDLIWFDERVSIFTPEEKKAVRRYVEYMRDFHGNDLEEDAQKALDRYWNRF